MSPEGVPSVQPARASPWRRVAKLIALALVLSFAVAFVSSDAKRIGHSLRSMEAWQLGLGGLAITAGLLSAMLAWRTLLSGMGSPLPLLASARIYFLGQLGKYIPGSVWPIVAQAELASEYGTPRTRAGVAALIQMLLSVITGTVFAGLALSLSSADAIRAYWWLAVVAGGAILLLLPPVFTPLLTLAGRILRRPTGEVSSVPPSALVASAGWCMLMWLFFGAHAFALSLAFSPASPRLAFVSSGAYALAWVVGFAVVILPAGAGAREAALALGLAPLLTVPQAVTVAIVSRVLMLAADVLSAVIAVTAERRRKRSKVVD